MLPYYYQFVSPYVWGGCSWNSFNMLYYFAGFNGYLLDVYKRQDYLSFLTLRMKNCPTMPDLDRQDYVILNSTEMCIRDSLWNVVTSQPVRSSSS